MCYGYTRDFWRDIEKDVSREPEERPEPRVEAKAKDTGFRFFPRRSREFTVEEPEAVPAGRAREKV